MHKAKESKVALRCSALQAQPQKDSGTDPVVQ